MTIHGMTRTGLATPIGSQGIPVLGDSRKYPYPTMGGIKILTHSSPALAPPMPSSTSEHLILIFFKPFGIPV